MNRLPTTLIAITATMALWACGDDENGGAATRAWNAQIAGLGDHAQIEGEATVRADMETGTFTATVTIRNDNPGDVHPWHVHFGTCESGGDIVGPPTLYPSLLMEIDGTATVETMVVAALDPDVDYHVNVHLSQADLGTIIACGDLVLQGSIGGSTGGGNGDGRY